MEKLTKEKAIELYLKMVGSKNSIVYGGRVELYSERNIIATATLIANNFDLSVSDFPCVLSICPSGLGGEFRLTDQEYNDLINKTQNINFKKLQEDFIKFIIS